MPLIGCLPIAATSLVGERRQLLRDQEGIAAAAHVEHSLIVEIEAGLEAIVAAQDLHRQPSRHDLGDGGRDEGLVSVLGHQFVALGVHHQHQPRRSKRGDLLGDAGEGRGGEQEQSEGEQARPQGDSSEDAASAIQRDLNCDVTIQGLSQSRSHSD